VSNTSVSAVIVIHVFCAIDVIAELSVALNAGVLAGKFVSVAPDFNVICDALLEPIVILEVPLLVSIVSTSIFDIYAPITLYAPKRVL
jgi:hypothetical protein